MIPDIANREGLAEYDITWPWRFGELRDGLTAVLRVRNEARNLPWVLPPVLRAVDAVILVDNQSDDGTADVARCVADANGLGDRLTITSYPFDVSRCGAEHLGTAGDSVHSLTHYYNWSFSHATTTYSMKWDGDMVLTSQGEQVLADLSWQLSDNEVIVRFQHQPMYIESDRVGYLDDGLRPTEPFIYPMGPEYTFLKAFEWELRDFPEEVERILLPERLCVELKWLDADEFAHWTDPGAMSATSGRKRRELEVFSACAEGRWKDIDGLVRIEAPPGVHIVDHVTTDWLA